MAESVAAGTRRLTFLAATTAATSVALLAVQIWIAIDLVPRYADVFAGYIPIAAAPFVLLSRSGLLVLALVLARVALFAATYGVARRAPAVLMLAPIPVHLMATVLMWVNFSIVLRMP